MQQSLSSQVQLILGQLQRTSNITRLDRCVRQFRSGHLAQESKRGFCGRNVDLRRLVVPSLAAVRPTVSSGEQLLDTLRQFAMLVSKIATSERGSALWNRPWADIDQSCGCSSKSSSRSVLSSPASIFRVCFVCTSTPICFDRQTVAAFHLHSNTSASRRIPIS
jgi:hypothetical protein